MPLVTEYLIGMGAIVLTIHMPTIQCSVQYIKEHLDALGHDELLQQRSPVWSHILLLIVGQDVTAPETCLITSITVRIVTASLHGHPEAARNNSKATTSLEDYPVHCVLKFDQLIREVFTLSSTGHVRCPVTTLHRKTPLTIEHKPLPLNTPTEHSP